MSVTIAKPLTRDSAVEVRPARQTRWFYVWMAGACLGIAVGGFAPTYWMGLTRKRMRAARSTGRW